MRRWLRAVAPAAAEVADQPWLWLPGALAWSVSVGWIALVAGVATPPGVGELTFLGARAATSGLWPWNLVAALVGAGLVLAGAFALAALAETTLLRGRRASADDVRRAFTLALACALPAAAALAALGGMLPLVAQDEFNAPEPGVAGPLLRTAGRVAPLLAAMAAAAIAGGAVHAVAIRSALAGEGAGAALRAAPLRLAALGAAGVLQAVGLTAVRIGYVVLAAVLLRVLWEPIGLRLADEGLGVAGVLLLVGFVAIWLCLVLAGGALHAWGSVSWTRLLAAREGGVAADPQQLERSSGS